MNKLKLHIQFFSSTNETTHYNLSQYIGSDKPTYLVDYNSDMSKIDTGIYNADAKGTQANGNIGNMSDLTTTATTDLVSAINEVDAHADTNATNISNNTTDIATNTSAIGTIANLQTTDKTNLVNAINEVKGVNDTQNTNINNNTIDIQAIQSEVEKFNLDTFISYDSTNSDFSSKTTVSGVEIKRCNINVARNSDGSIFKIYGSLTWKANSADGYITLKNTGITPTSAFDIFGGIYQFVCTSSDYNVITNANIETLHIESNGDIKMYIVAPPNTYKRYTMPPCLYFAKNFGDLPE